MSDDLDRFRRLSDQLLWSGDADTHMTVPLSMSWDFDQPDRTEFIIGTRLGGIDMRPRDRIVTIIDARTNRKAKRARCKARRRARLPRRNWVARRR